MLAHADADADSSSKSERTRFPTSFHEAQPTSLHTHPTIIIYQSSCPTNQVPYQTSDSHTISFRYPSNQQLATRGTTPGYSQAPAEAPYVVYLTDSRVMSYQSSTKTSFLSSNFSASLIIYSIQSLSGPFVLYPEAFVSRDLVSSRQTKAGGAREKEKR